MGQSAIDTESLAAVLEELVALVALERQGDLDLGRFLQALDQRDAAEGGREVDVELDAVGAVGVVPARA